MRPRLMVKATLAVVLLGCAALSLVSCGDDRAGTPKPQVRSEQATREPALNYRGLAIQITHGLNAFETYAPLLKEVADLGADTVLLSIAGYMEHAHAQMIVPDLLRTPSKEDFVDLLLKAKEYKLRVVLMPIVLLRYPRGSEWRG